MIFRLLKARIIGFSTNYTTLFTIPFDRINGIRQEKNVKVEPLLFVFNNEVWYD
jgi:hypothetical protein